MKHRFAVIVLLGTTAIYFGFALWFAFRPEFLLETFGIDQRSPGMLTEIRAFYGGIELGIGVAMLLLWKQGNISAALLVGGLPLAGLALGRCVGMMADGFSSTHVTSASVEFVGSTLCLLGVFAIYGERSAGA